MLAPFGGININRAVWPIVSKIAVALERVTCTRNWQKTQKRPIQMLIVALNFQLLLLLQKNSVRDYRKTQSQGKKAEIAAENLMKPLTALTVVYLSSFLPVVYFVGCTTGIRRRIVIVLAEYFE